MSRPAAIVVGAGVSGLVSASTLLDQGLREVVVIDEYERVGGNHLDQSIGGYTFDVGSFIFQDDSPLLRHFPELLALYVDIDPSWARVNPQGVVTQYPFSVRDDLLAAGPVEIARITASALRARLDRRPLTNARDFARHWVGDRFLQRSGLEHYMARFCGCPISEIDLDFAQSRMMWLPEQARASNAVRRVRDHLVGAAESPRTNRQLARPAGGFRELYEPAVRRLADRGVDFQLGATDLAISPGRDGFSVKTAAQRYQTGRVVSTIPLGRMREMCDLPVAEPLPSVTLLTLFYSFGGDRGFAESILYNFSHTAAWKRLTVYSDFYGRVGGREYFAVEVISGEGGTPTETAAEEFRRHTTRLGLFTGDLRLEGSHVLREAYPVYSGRSADRATRMVAELRDLGIESFGRQGAFRYQPTARVSTLEAEAALRSM